MKTFKVRVIADTTVYADIKVKARDEAQAEEIAQKKANEGSVKWNISDNDKQDIRIDSDSTEEL